MLMHCFHNCYHYNHQHQPTFIPSVIHEEHDLILLQNFCNNQLTCCTYGHGPRVLRIKQDCCSLNQTTKAINSYTPLLLCHKIFDPASVVWNKCNIFYLSGLMQTPNTTLCLPHLHHWRIFLGRHLIKDFWRASDLITRHPQLHPVIARLQNPSCNQCNLMIRLHDDTVDRILEGDEEGDVVLHANPPKPVLWVRSSCLSGALNGPD